MAQDPSVLEVPDNEHSVKVIHEALLDFAVGSILCTLEYLGIECNEAEVRADLVQDEILNEAARSHAECLMDKFSFDPDIAQA